MRKYYVISKDTFTPDRTSFTRDIFYEGKEYIDFHEVMLRVVDLSLKDQVNHYSVLIPKNHNEMVGFGYKGSFLYFDRHINNKDMQWEYRRIRERLSNEFYEKIPKQEVIQL